MNSKLYTEVVSHFYCTIDIEKKKKFNIGANAISSLFDRCLNKQYKGLVKILIELTDKNIYYTFDKPSKVSPFCHIVQSFNFSYYFAQNKLERRKIILETLYDSIKKMCQQLNYDLEPFTKAYQKVKELNYINKYIHGKMIFAKNRKHKAGIEIEVNEDVATISTLFTDKNNKPLLKLGLLKTLPHYMFIYRIIHKGKWISTSEYQVSDRSGQINFVAKLSGDSTLILNPKNSTEKELYNILNKYNTSSLSTFAYD